MNWAGAVDWYVNQYLYESGRDSRLKAYLQRNGKKQVMLTEWCAWEGDKDGFVTNEDNQIDQMVQKVQLMELSDNVAGYAWFMGIGGSFNNSYPYWHIFTGSDSDLHFTELGRIYTNMSSFDKSCWWKPGQLIPAKDYIDMSECKLRHNTDVESEQKIELSKFQQYISWDNSTITPYVDYQVNVGTTKDYTLSLRLCNEGGTALELLVDGTKVADANLPSTGAQWLTQTTVLPLTAGTHTLRLRNVSQNDNKMNWLRIEGSEDDSTDEPTAIGAPTQRSAQPVSVTFHDLSGREISPNNYQGIAIRSCRYADGIVKNEKWVLKP